MTLDELFVPRSFVSRRVMLGAENSNQHAAECRERLEYSAGTACRCGQAHDVGQTTFVGCDEIHELQ
jgi:hypothetical protein